MTKSAVVDHLALVVPFVFIQSHPSAPAWYTESLTIDLQTRPSKPFFIASRKELLKLTRIPRNYVLAILVRSLSMTFSSVLLLAE